MDLLDLCSFTLISLDFTQILKQQLLTADGYLYTNLALQYKPRACFLNNFLFGVVKARFNNRPT